MHLKAIVLFDSINGLSGWHFTRIMVAGEIPAFSHRQSTLEISILLIHQGLKLTEAVSHKDAASSLTK